MKKLILFLSLLLSLNTRAATAPVLLGGNTNDQVLFVFFLSNGMTNADRIIAGLNTNGTLKFNTNLIAYGFLPVGQTNWIFTGATNSAWLASLGLTNGQYVAATNAAWLASLGLTNTPFTAATNWGNTLHLDLNATGHSITNANIVKATSFIGDGSGLTSISGGGGVTSNSFQTNLTAVGADNHDALTISSTSSNNAIALTAVNNYIVALPPSDTNANGNNIFISGSRSGPNGSSGGAVYIFGGPSTNGNSGAIVLGDTNIAEMVISPSDQTVNINSQLYVGEVDVGTGTLLAEDGSFYFCGGNIGGQLSGELDVISLSLYNGDFYVNYDGTFVWDNAAQSDGNGGLNNNNGFNNWSISGDSGAGEFSTVSIDAGDSTLHGNTGFFANGLLAWDSDDTTWANLHITGGTNTPLVLDSTRTFIKFSGTSSTPATNLVPFEWIAVTVGSDTNCRVPVFH